MQANDELACVLSARFGTAQQTIYKWKHRGTVYDPSQTPHQLQATVTPAQELVAVVLRRTLLLSLDDLQAVVRKFLTPQVLRSDLDRCLWRHAVDNQRNLQAQSPWPTHPAFKAQEPRYPPVDVSYLLQMVRNLSSSSCSWRSTGQRAGCSSASIVPKQPSTRAAFCVIWNRPARCACALF